MPNITVNDVTISYVDLGDGQPFILSHSLLTDRSVWEPVIDAAGADYRFVNVDLRGHGDSTGAMKPFDFDVVVDDMVAVLDDLEIERAVWCGVSVGAMVSLHAALSHPERISGLVLVNGDAEAEGLAGRVKLRALELMMRLVGMRPVAEAFAPKLFAPAVVAALPELVATWQQTMLAVDPVVGRHWVDCIRRRKSLIPHLGDVRAPTLILSAANDQLFSPRKSDALHKGISHSRLEVLQDEGHLCILEDTTATVALLIDFAAELDRLPRQVG